MRLLLLKEILLLAACHLHACSCLSYDPADYPEVYPDPEDPTVLMGRTPLHFALIQSLGGPLSQFDGSGSVAGVKVALDRINNDTSLLPGYTLHYTFADSKCNRTESLNAIFSQVLHEPTKLAVIGSGCSVATEPTAEVSHFYNISHISCVSSSTALRDRVRFPSYFQLLSTEETLAFAYYGVIKEFEWRRIALIVQNENLFTVTISRLTDLLDRDDVNHNTKMFDTNDGIAGLGDNPFDEGSRIFLLAMYSVNARPLLCEAYKRGIHLPQNLLLTPGWYARQWWRVDNENLSCTIEEREFVLSSSLAFLHFRFLNETADANFTTDTGITGGEFLAKEMQFLGRPPLNLTFLEYSQYCYDATWTLAYALNRTLNSISDLALNGVLASAYNVTGTFNLEDFRYDSARLLEVVFGHVRNTSFGGVTGPVSFGDQGIRKLNELIIFQFRNVVNVSTGDASLDWVKVGNVTPFGDDDYNFTYGPQETIDTLWQGLVPYDGVPMKEIASIHVAITVIFTLLSLLGITFAVACLIFNFLFRKSKLIKLASSKLNYLIGIGAIVLYVNSIIFVIPARDSRTATVLCNITPWLTAIGYSLCYGTILTKTARVYYIFTNPSPTKKGIQDWMLLVAVGLLVVVDLTIIITYMVVVGTMDGLGAREMSFVENPQDTQGELAIITNYCVFICDSKARNIFLGILYGYKMLLQVVALLLAFSIRRVKVKGLDDAKYIAASIYVTSIVLAVTIVGTYSLPEIVNGFTVLICTGFMIGTTVILALVFVPLMVRLFKDPKGENIFERSSVGDHVSSFSMMTKGTLKTSNEVDMLKQRIKELEEELEKTKKSPSVKNEAISFSDPKARLGSISHALENSKMGHNLVKERTFSGTIWDSPEERHTIKEDNTAM